MANYLTKRLKELSDIFVVIDKKLGYKKFRQYLLLVLIVIGLINIKSVLKGAAEVYLNIMQEIHSEKMTDRDELNAELVPILVSFRAEVGADRILYYEFHNSKENVLGIPFNYFELTLQDHNYETPGVAVRNSDNGSQSINTGYIVKLYDKLKRNEIVICRGDYDFQFQNTYAGLYELFHANDSSKTVVFASIPGISKPVGFIALEWMKNNAIAGQESQVEQTIRRFIPRMNALIVSTSRRRW